MSQSKPVLVTVKADSLRKYGIAQGDVLIMEERTAMMKGNIYAIDIGSRSDIGRLYLDKDGGWWAELPAFNAIVPVTRRNLVGMVTGVMKMGMEF